MKTKDFIKMLQEADPDGDCHVRLRGSGVPYRCNCNQGYYDGDYDYIDDEGNFVISREAWKLDVYTKDLGDFLWEEGKTPDNVKFKGLYDRDIEHYRKFIDETYKEAVTCHDQIMNEMLERVQAKVKEGWLLLQEGANLKNCAHFWTVRTPEDFRFYEPPEWREDTENQKKMVCGEGRAITQTGKFKPGKQYERFTIWEPIDA